MSLEGQFHRYGERKIFRVLNDECLGCACFDPVTLVEEQGREHATCRTYVASGCPSPGSRNYSADKERERLRRWIRE